MSPADLRRLAGSPEVLSFLAVGGAGYVVDVLAFNLLRSTSALAGLDPTLDKTLAVAAAMVVTYIGNRMVTWRDDASSDRRREVMLFVVFNVIGLGMSVVSLFVSHHLLGLTSAVDDNISANVVGVALGTAFRFWSYRRFVFTGARTSHGGRSVSPAAVGAPGLAPAPAPSAWR